MALDNKISNIIGTKLPTWLLKQLDFRAQMNSQDSRDNNNLLFLANKTAWVRVVSSINLINENDINYFNRLTGGTISNQDDLAKQFVLFGGTSKYINRNSYQIRSGLGQDGAYGILGNEEVKKYGYRPMPGITSVNIETQGRLGSVRSATINFKCWDKDQLDIIDALYFKLGFTMFLEWGNTYFYKADDNTKVLSSDLYSIDPFQNELTKEEISLQISKNTRATEGNYDAMLGIVTNFNFSLNQEGGFDCSLRLMGLGVLGDSIKINNQGVLPDILKEEIKLLTNTLVEISSKAALEEAARKAKEALEAAEKEKESQISILRELNSKINNKDVEPSLSELGRIVQQAGYAGSKTVSINDYDFLYNISDVRGWSLFLPTFGASIPTNTINELVSSITLDNDYLFEKVSNFLNFNTSNQSNPIAPNQVQNIPGTAIPSFQSQVPTSTLEASLETSMFFSSINENIPDELNLNIDYLGSNTKTYYTSIRVEFDRKNPKFKKELLNRQLVYEAAISKLRESSNFEFKDIAFETRTVSENFGYRVKQFGTVSKNTNQTAGRYPVIVVSTTINVDVPGTVLKDTPGVEQTTVQQVAGTITIPVNIDIITTDSDLISAIKKGGLSPNYLATQQNIVDQNQEEAAIKEEQAREQQALYTQLEQALKTQSALELTLRTIQVHALTKAINDSNKDLEIGRRVYTLELTNLKDTTGGKPFLEQIFSNGIFTNFIKEFADTSKNSEDKFNDLKIRYTNGNIDRLERLKLQAKYGFATNLMAGKSSINSFTANDFKTLLTAYVVPYQINQEIYQGVPTNHPVYIPLGLVLMLLNHSCTMYDSKKESTVQTPMVYVDFSTEHNFCLSNTKQLSTNPWVTLIPFEGGFEGYKKIFDPYVLDGDYIKPISGSEEKINLFNPDTQDVLSPQLPIFKDIDNIYRGRVMNILLNIDYLVKLVKDYSSKDETNSIYLKTFIEQILSDLNRFLGNVNIFRLAYNDQGNTFHIVDDQVIPVKSGNQDNKDTEEEMLRPDNTTSLPVYGKFSIAKNLEIKTEISSKLSNMLAVSANADVPSKSTLSTNGDNFGYINTNYVDRYITNRKEINTGSVASYDTIINSSAQFNKTIYDFYSTINPSEASVGHATNYFIDRISKIKNEEYPTRASAMIPVSVNFTTDGISGLSMGQSFTIPDQLLPYTYNDRIIQNQPGLNKDHINKVGFVVVGLNHNLENNQWNTSIRANMIFLKNKTEFVGSVVRAKSTGSFEVDTSNSYSNNYISQTRFIGSNKEAKQAAETYLGRVMTDLEWSQLVAATFAEASGNQEERAWVMAVILNRTRTKYLGATTITDTLSKKNQFQAVTGTSKNFNRPSDGYVKGPDSESASLIYGAAINILSTVPKNYLYFTSNIAAAYGPGTNIGFRDKLVNAEGSKIIGNTIFSITT